MGVTGVEQRRYRKKLGEENADILVEVDAKCFLELIMEHVAEVSPNG